MKKEVIGHIDCPVCGSPHMEIKEDKNSHAYGHCSTDCNAQVFTRNTYRDARLRARMRPVTVTVAEPNIPPGESGMPVAPVSVAPARAVTAPTLPPAKKKAAAWFTPILAGDGE